MKDVTSKMYGLKFLGFGALVIGSGISLLSLSFYMLGTMSSASGSMIITLISTMLVVLGGCVAIDSMLTKLSGNSDYGRRFFGAGHGARDLFEK